MQKFRRLLFPLLTLCLLLLLGGYYWGSGGARGSGLPARTGAAPAVAAEPETGAARNLSPAPTAPSLPGGAAAADQARLPLDLNRADLESLQTLPGIGPVLAQRILDYRAEQGPFRDTAELINIRGIGEKTLAGLRDLIYVEENDEDPDH